MVLLLIFPDPTLTLHNITTAMRTVPVERWGDLAGYLGVPWPKQDEMWIQFNGDGQMMVAALEYWRNTVPGASWESLATALVFFEWDMALQEATKYFQGQRGIKCFVEMHICTTLLIDSSSFSL